uniref:ELAV n=1 Tax=Holothuria glaberrima TaxID=31192 RepID=A0A0P0BZH8_HOLGL|nr:ELAV [Holothuria glaberrima]
MEQIAHQLPAHHPLMQNLNHQNNHQTSHQSHPNGMVQPASPTDSMEDISKTNLIINYLPQEMNQEEIKELFGKFGEIESCKLVKDKLTGQSLGYGFVNFMKASEAAKAKDTLDGLKVEKKKLKVSYARPSSPAIKDANLYISGIPRMYSEKELQNLFAEYGEIITSKLLYDNGTSRGVGFVRFDRRQQAEAAINALHNTIPPGGTEPLVVKFASNPSQHYQKALQQFYMTGQLPMQISPTRRNNIYNTVGPGPVRHITPFSPFRTATAPADTFTQMNQMVLTNNGNGWCIFVYNLPPETEENLLWQLFGPFGAVTNVKVVRDFNTRKCKGFGFVTMTNYEEAYNSVVSLNGYLLGSKYLQVSFKTNKSTAGKI